MSSDNNFYSPKEVANMIGHTTAHTLAVWRCKNKHPELRFKKIGGLIRYFKTSVDAFISDDLD